jgi:hypothetical protein
MKKLLFATLAIASFALPASAGVILPNLFANEYCGMRELGVSEDDAMKVATRESMISGEPVRVEFNGVMVDSDVLRALQAATELCPQFM